MKTALCEEEPCLNSLMKTALFEEEPCLNSLMKTALCVRTVCNHVDLRGSRVHGFLKVYTKSSCTSVTNILLIEEEISYKFSAIIIVSPL